MALSLAGSAYAEPPPPKVVPSSASANDSGARTALLATVDRARYSQRQANAPGLEKYKGGDLDSGIYIGGGALVLIAVVVILLVVF